MTPYIILAILTISQIIIAMNVAVQYKLEYLLERFLERKDPRFVKVARAIVQRFDTLFDEDFHYDFQYECDNDSGRRFLKQNLQRAGLLLLGPITCIVIFSKWAQIADYAITKFFNPKLLPR